MSAPLTAARVNSNIAERQFAFYPAAKRVYRIYGYHRLENFCFESSVSPQDELEVSHYR
jgi:hypothetical protein